ncbi:MAG: DUF2155 domain-containing protein [Alphaproteobacteria bacterium]|nr:DUF2155 domain-containing protein [Alphaproteobacteria bacterium]
MINKSKLSLGTILSCGVLINAAFAGDISMNTAKLQAMDKITGRVSEVIAPVNGIVNFGSFSILVRKCTTKSSDQIPENTAFIDVVDNYNTTGPVNIFKGWMFSSTPALNAVEHPIYDIWLLECFNQKNDNTKLLTEEQLAIRDSIPMSRQEKIETGPTLSDISQEITVDTPQETTETVVETTDDEQFASEGEEHLTVEEETSPEEEYSPESVQNPIIIKE